MWRPDERHEQVAPIRADLDRVRHNTLRRILRIPCRGFGACLPPLECGVSLLSLPCQTAITEASGEDCGDSKGGNYLAASHAASLTNTCPQH